MSSWETHDPGDEYRPGSYSPDKYYVRHTDSKGHGGRLNLNLSRQLIAQAERIIQLGIIPRYRTVGDFAADAFVHRLHYIGRKFDDGEIIRTVSLASIAADARQRQEDRQLFIKMKDDIEAYFQDLYNAEEHDKVRDHALRLMQDKEAVPPEWRREYTDMLEKHLKRVGP